MEIAIKKIHFHLFIILLALSLFTNSTSAYYQEKTILSGESEEINQTIKVISLYTPVLEEKIKNEEKNSISYLEKPEIVITKTRKEIDQEKYQAAQKQLAQSKRNVITRERSQATASTQVATIKTPRQDGNSYWYGFCTWYAANKRSDIPNSWGNAKAWLGSAQKAGWTVGSEPKAGAVIVTTESWAGHVGFVEKVDGNSVIISEMNFEGWGRITSRTLDKNDSVIRGYIY